MYVLPMVENKTQPTQASVDVYLAGIADESRRDDCRELVRLMTRVTGHPAVMWGPGIVGFGSYHYKYESGREGDCCQVGFASRKGDISIYLMAGFPGREELLAKLGRHKLGKACLYVRQLGDLDLAVLERLVAGSIAEVRRRYP
jgi:hypothetical protein